MVATAGKCEVCGAPTKVFKSSGRVQRTCGMTCYTKLAYEEGRKKRGIKPPKECPICGGHYPPNISKCPNAMCRWMDGRAIMKVCAGCGGLFDVSRSPNKGSIQKQLQVRFCSIGCRAKAQSELRTGQRTVHRFAGWDMQCVRICDTCGKLLPPHADKRIPKHRPPVSYCSNHCKWHAKDVSKGLTRHLVCRVCKGAKTSSSSATCLTCREQNRKRHHHAANKRRRARQYGSKTDRGITKHALHDRDGGRCNMCGRKCKLEWNAKNPNRCSTIGHIVALSRGGHHTWNNVQLECWECNTQKGDKAIGQLRLPIPPTRGGKIAAG